MHPATPVHGWPPVHRPFRGADQGQSEEAGDLTWALGLIGKTDFDVIDLAPPPSSRGSCSSMTGCRVAWNASSHSGGASRHGIPHDRSRGGDGDEPSGSGLEAFLAAGGTRHDVRMRLRRMRALVGRHLMKMSCGNDHDHVLPTRRAVLARRRRHRHRGDDVQTSSCEGGVVEDAVGPPNAECRISDAPIGTIAKVAATAVSRWPATNAKTSSLPKPKDRRSHARSIVA
jgi:hypothetical protein